MNEDTFAQDLVYILGNEGGFANLKNDEVTNLGVTKTTWESYIGHRVSVDDMKKLTVAMVTPLYRKRYYEAALCPVLPIPLRLCVFDFAVNSGPGRALSTLALVLGCPNSKEAIVNAIGKTNSTQFATISLSYLHAREHFLKGLKNFYLYGRGWLNRVGRLEHYVRAFL